MTPTPDDPFSGVETRNTPPDSFHLTTLDTNIKPKPGRPKKITLGRKVTILCGDHGVGKTRWEQAASLLLRKEVRDVAFRHDDPRKDPGTLLRLTRPLEEKRLYVAGTFSSRLTVEVAMPITQDDHGVPHGGRLTRKALTKGQSLPDWLENDDRIMPLSDIEASLRRKPEEARSEFSPMILGSIPPDKIRSALLATRKMEPEAVQKDFEAEGLEIPSSLDRLMACRETLTTQLDLLRSTVKGQEAATLVVPDEPIRGHGDYLGALLTLGRKWENALRSKMTLAELEGKLGNARMNLDKVAPDPGEEPVVPPHPSTVIKAQAPAPVPTQTPVDSPFTPVLKVQEMMFPAAGNPGATCMACAGPLSVVRLGEQYAKTMQFHMMITSQAPTAPSQPTAPTGPTEAELLAWNTANAVRVKWAEQDRVRRLAKTEITRLEAQVELAKNNVKKGGDEVTGSIQAVISSSAALGQDGMMLLGRDAAQDIQALANMTQPAQVAAWLETTQAEKTKVDQQVGAWDLYQGQKANSDATKDRIPRVARLIDAVNQATRDLIQGGLSTFLARMSTYMIPGWDPVILLEDERGSQTFTLALREDGVVCYDPSGVQSLNLLCAFAIALHETNPPPYMLLSAVTECHISPTKLPALVTALSKAPDWVQTLLATTGPVPERVAGNGCVVIDLDALAVKAGSGSGTLSQGGNPGEA